MICVDRDINGFLYEKVTTEFTNCTYLFLDMKTNDYSSLVLLDSTEITKSFTFGFTLVISFWVLGFVAKAAKTSIRKI
jgi:hypothetical protein